MSATTMAITGRRPGAADVNRLARADIYKIWHTRSLLALAVVALAPVLLGLVLTLSLQEIGSATDVRSLLSFSGTGGLVALLFGVVVTGGEYRHRTIVPTALVEPRRVRAYVAHLAALTLTGLVIGLAAATITTAVTLGWLSAASPGVAVSATDVVSAAAGGTVYTALAVLIGGGIGAITRNQVAAAIAAFLYLSMVDPLVGMAVPAYGQFGPVAVGIAMGGAAPDPSGGPGAQLLPPLAAGAVWLGYALVVALIGLYVTVRREIR